MEQVLGITEAAEFLGFSKNYLYKMIHQKKIAHFKPTGGKVYFKVSDLEKFLFRNRRAADFELYEQAENILNGKGA